MKAINKWPQFSGLPCRCYRISEGSDDSYTLPSVRDCSSNLLFKQGKAKQWSDIRRTWRVRIGHIKTIVTATMLRCSSFLAYTTELARCAFSVAAPSTRNSLPADIRLRENILTFKRHLKTHLFKLTLSSCTSSSASVSRT